jgi:hypothetical protein
VAVPPRSRCEHVTAHAVGALTRVLAVAAVRVSPTDCRRSSSGSPGSGSCGGVDIHEALDALEKHDAEAVVMDAANTDAYKCRPASERVRSDVLHEGCTVVIRPGHILGPRLADLVISGGSVVEPMGQTHRRCVAGLGSYSCTCPQGSQS